MSTMKTLKFPGSNNVYEMVDAIARAGVASLQTAVGGLVDDTLATSGKAADAAAVGAALAEKADAAEVSDLKRTITDVESAVYNVSDEMGSVYANATDMMLNIANATKYPMYKYHLGTYPKNYSGGSVVDGGTRQVSSQVFTSDHPMLFRLTTYGKSLVDAGYTVYRVALYDWNGSTFDTSSFLAIETTDIVNYEYSTPDYQHRIILVTSPSDVVNEVTDINDVIEIYSLSPWYPKDRVVTMPDVNQMYPLINSEGTVIGNPQSNRVSYEWNILVNARNAKYIYSDAVAFDYALFDVDGNCIKRLDNAYTTCCISVPNEYNGKIVDKVRANIIMRTRNNNGRLLQYKPIIYRSIYVAYDVPITHAPVPTQDASVALDNARRIINLYEQTNYTYRPQHGVDNPIETYNAPGIPYRTVDRQQVGYSRSFETYMSSIDAAYNKSLSAATLEYSTVTAGDGDYGLMCAGFIMNVLQSPLFISTSTFYYYKHDVLRRISDLSQAEPGDILFWDGLSGDPVRSNHVAIMVDKITVGDALEYVIIAESTGRGGCRYTVYHPPFIAGDRDLYKAALADTGIVPKSVISDPFVPGDAAFMRNYNNVIDYARCDNIRDANYDLNPLTFRSFWGNKVNIANNSLQNIYVKCTNSVPNYTTLKVYKGDDLIGTYALSSVMDAYIQSGKVGRFALSKVTTGDGYYTMYVDDTLMAEMYIYNRVASVSASDRILNLSPFVDDGFDIDKCFIRTLYEQDQGRAKQYVFRPLTDSEKVNASVTLADSEDRFFIFNNYGGCDISISFIDSDDNDGDGDRDEMQPSA